MQMSVQMPVQTASCMKRHGTKQNDGGFNATIQGFVHDGANNSITMSHLVRNGDGHAGICLEDGAHFWKENDTSC